VVNPERNVTLALIPLGFVSILIGIALLVITTAVYFLSRHRLRTTDSGLSASGRG
jgi:heme/copper-type cytochrome/quinol oxidase subunit 2